MAQKAASIDTNSRFKNIPRLLSISIYAINLTVNTHVGAANSSTTQRTPTKQLVVNFANPVYEICHVYLQRSLQFTLC